MKDTFLLYTNMRSTFDSMSDEQAGIIIKALFADQAGDVVELDGLLNTVFTQIKTQVDYNNAKYDTIKQARAEAGKKGGEAKASKSKQIVANCSKSKQSQANVPNDNVNDNDNDNVSPKGDKRLSPVKHKYGEYGNVLLTDEELDKLKAKFPSNYMAWIDRLSGYVESTGKKYKSHYATILNWSKRDDNTRASPSFGKFEQNEYDFDSLEEQLLANGGKHGQSI